MSHRKRTYIVYHLYYYSAFCNSRKNGKWVWSTQCYTRTELLKSIRNGRYPKDLLEHYIEEPWKVDTETLPKSSYNFNINFYYVVHAGKVLTLDYLRQALSTVEHDSSKRRKRKQAHANFIYRYDPVPSIGRWHYGSYYRLGRLGQVRKKNNLGREDEYHMYNSNKYAYKNLPQWDDCPRYIDKSWKTSCKCRKQWQKKVPKHTKHIYNLTAGYKDVPAI